jgi:prevent-host-death family protein
VTGDVYGRYVRSMSEVTSREPRNDTVGVLRRVREGEDVTITVNGQPVAVLAAVRLQRRRWLSKTELLSRLRRAQADPGLREDLGPMRQ